MPIERRRSSRASLIDVLDRVLDKGIVIDAWRRVSFGGINLLEFDSHWVVSSIETHQRYATSIEDLAPLWARAQREMSHAAVHAEHAVAASAARSKGADRSVRVRRRLPRLIVSKR